MKQFLEQVGRIRVPPAALKHRFVAEAAANALMASRKEEERNRVVGTANSRLVELYGWGGGVAPHVDNTGWVYLCPIELQGESTVFCSDARGETLELRLRPGAVVRLWDYAVHRTCDEGWCCAMFLGSFEEPSDAVAIEAFSRAVAQLARGTYYGAPRVRDGYRALLADECYAARPDMQSCEVMRQRDAERRGRWVQTCTACGARAVRLDEFWPYYMDRNRCWDHLVPQENE